MKSLSLMGRLKGILSERIMLLDGAYGTAIQQYGLKEEDFRGNLLAKHSKALIGNNDVLILLSLIHI